MRGVGCGSLECASSSSSSSSSGVVRSSDEASRCGESASIASRYRAGRDEAGVAQPTQSVSLSNRPPAVANHAVSVTRHPARPYNNVMRSASTTCVLHDISQIAVAVMRGPQTTDQGASVESLAGDRRNVFAAGIGAAYRRSSLNALIGVDNATTTDDEDETDDENGLIPQPAPRIPHPVVTVRPPTSPPPSRSHTTPSPVPSAGSRRGRRRRGRGA